MQDGSAPAAEPAADPAVEKFKSCRWKATPDQGDFCTHRDVLPFAGKEGFKPESWCPECAFYKLRRTPKKRGKDRLLVLRPSVLLRKLPRQLNPLPLRRQVLVRLPVRLGVWRPAGLLERDGEIEVPVRVGRVERNGFVVTGQRLGEAAEIVVDVARG